MHKDDWFDTDPTTLNQYTLTDLVPGDRYQFEVVTLSEWTESQPETIEESICKCLLIMSTIEGFSVFKCFKCENV